MSNTVEELKQFCDQWAFTEKYNAREHYLNISENPLATAREGVGFGQAESCERQEVHIEWQWQMFKVQNK